MATAITNIVPFKRKRVSFKSRTTGEPVTYYEVHAYDANGEIVVVRSSDQAKVEGLTLGAVHQFEGVVRGPGTVPATVIRPAGEQQESTDF